MNGKGCGYAVSSKIGCVAGLHCHDGRRSAAEIDLRSRCRPVSSLARRAPYGPRSIQTARSVQRLKCPPWPLEGQGCVFRVGGYLGAMERNANRGRSYWPSIPRPPPRLAVWLRQAWQEQPRPSEAIPPPLAAMVIGVRPTKTVVSPERSF
jgi:hypothetical protein